MREYAKSLNANEILELIFKYLTEVSSLRNRDEIIIVLAEMGRSLTSADRCSIWVISEDSKTIWTKVSQGMEPITLPINSGIVGDAIVHSKKIIIEDVQNDPRFNQSIDKITGYITKSMMVIPMYDNESKIIGAFQVINYIGEKDNFDESDMNRLMLASNYTAETLVSGKLIQEIEDTQKEIIFTMGAIGESRSQETGNHVRRVAEYSKILALAVGLSKEEAEQLKQVSPMHDIGKIVIPDAILNKPGKLNKKEREIMDEHAKLGYEMTQISKRPLLKMASIVSYEHHEKWNGSGYPRGLVGEDIHIYGRITAIADVFDALGSDRVYKKAWKDADVLKYFKNERGKHFDPNLVDLFFENLESIYKVRSQFQDNYIEEVKINKNNIRILGAYGTKALGHATSSFYLNEKNVIDAGNLLNTLEKKSILLEHIWITHSHLDHICDIAYILDNYYDDLNKPIIICGLPQTISAIKKHFLNNIIWPDFSKIALKNSQKMCIKYMEIEYNQEYMLSNRESITPIQTDHTVPSCGYIYKKNNTSILITADTHDLTNIIEILNNNTSITTAIIECSFSSNMIKLATLSKHLTPKILEESLKKLQRDDISICINHMKPIYIDNITEELDKCCAKWSPKILQDGEILTF